MSASIVIADDHPLVLQGLRDLINSTREFEVVATCTNGAQALKIICDLKPEMALLDLTMPGMTGIDVLTAATRQAVSTRIIILAATATPRDIIGAMAEGAWGIIFKDVATEQVFQCLRDVATGHKWLPIEVFERARDKGPHAYDLNIENLLTPREWKVVLLAGDGRSNKDIARVLKVSEATVKMHLHHIYQKVGVKNRTALLNLAFRYRDKQP